MGAAKSIPWDEQSAAQRKRTLTAAKRRSVFDHQHPAYVFLVQEARKAGLLPTFEPDVYIHDSSALESNSVSRPFVWFVGPHATHIVWCDRPLTNASALVADMVALVGPTILYWDGTDTRTITTYDAANVMAGRAWNDLG